MGAKDCIDKALNAADGVNENDAMDLAEDIYGFIDQNKNNLDYQQKLAEHIKEKVADRAKQAQLDKFRVKQNAIARRKIKGRIENLIANGMPAKDAVLSTLEGSVRGLDGAATSVYTKRIAYNDRYQTHIQGQIQKRKQHIFKLLENESFNDDIARELFAEIEGKGVAGKSVTGNADAHFVAKLIHETQTKIRIDANNFGAGIGHLKGRIVKQTHDPMRMLEVGSDQWLNEIMPHLDIKRSFGDVSDKEAKHILLGIYDNLVVERDIDSVVSKNGKSLVKRLNAKRILHFKNADSWLDYSKKFGNGGNMFAASIAEADRMAQIIAQLDMLGTNPTHMINKIAGEYGVPIDPSNNLWKAMQVMTGEISHPSTPSQQTIARRMEFIRSLQSVSKLGGAVWSALGGDTVTMMTRMAFHGQPFIITLNKTLGNLLGGKTPKEQKDISYTALSALEANIDDMISRFGDNDHANMGRRMSRFTNQFFKITGLRGWTQKAKLISVNMVMARMGKLSVKSFDALDAQYKTQLGRHDITAREWEAFRQAKLQSGELSYIHPEKISDLSDELVASTLDNPAPSQAMITRQRVALEIKLRGFISDEVKNMVLEGDAHSKRIATRGTKAGTLDGEILRLIMQFKTFPIVHARRVLGSLRYGKTGGKRADASLLGKYMAASMISGYLIGAFSDVMSGRTPADPTRPETWLRALTRSGGLSIYGDVLAGVVNPYNDRSVSDLIMGPTAGMALNRGENLIKSSVHGEANSLKKIGINTLQENLPYQNAWFARIIINKLFFDGLREWADDGFKAKKARNLKERTGQTDFMYELTK